MDKVDKSAFFESVQLTGDAAKEIASIGVESVENGVRVDRVTLHAALDRWLDGVVSEQPMLEDGHEHVITFSGGGVQRDADDVLITDFTITTTQTRHV